MERDERILKVESFGLLLQSDSVEMVRNIVEGVMAKIGEDTDFDYRKFQWIAARLIWKVRIIDFEYVDNVLIAVRKGMKKYFDSWGIKIRIEYTERG